MTPTIAIVAPVHWLGDWRVLRTARAAVAIAPTALYVERRFLADSRAEARVPKGVVVRPIPDYPRTRLIWRLAVPRYAARVAATIAEARPRLVHVHDSGRLGLAVCAGTRRRLGDARIIFDYHDWIPIEVANACRQQRWLYDRYLPLVLALARRRARSADRLVATSAKHTELAAAQLGIARTLAIENVRPSVRVPPFDEARLTPTLLFAGAIMAVRGLETLVEALAALGGEVQAVLCGSVDDPAYLRQVMGLAERLGVANRIRHVGAFTSDGDIRRQVRRGAIGTVFALAGQRWDSGFSAVASGNKLFSYLTIGVPALVAAEYENMVAIAEGGGAGYRFESAAALARAAERIWHTPGEWDRLSANARAVAERMNDETCTADLTALYRELLAG